MFRSHQFRSRQFRACHRDSIRRRSARANGESPGRASAARALYRVGGASRHRGCPAREVRLVREPIPNTEARAKAHACVDADAHPDAEITVLLREEKVTITETVVPVERVTFVKHSVTVDQEIALERRRQEVHVVHDEASTEAATLPEKTLG